MSFVFCSNNKLFKQLSKQTQRTALYNFPKYKIMYSNCLFCSKLQNYLVYNQKGQKEKQQVLSSKCLEILLKKTGKKMDHWSEYLLVNFQSNDELIIGQNASVPCDKAWAAVHLSAITNTLQPESWQAAEQTLKLKPWSDYQKESLRR